MKWTDALRLAVGAHAGQLDKAGQPYILHPLRVSMRIARITGYDEPAAVVALLHDVLEDTDTDVWDLISEGYSDEIIQAVEAITHREGESYTDYLKRVKQNDIALIVKLADISDNLGPERLDLLEPELAVRLIEKYGIALETLR